MLWRDYNDEVQLNPVADDCVGLFHFLKKMTQEFQLLLDATMLEFFEVHPLDLRGAEIARDRAIKMWNKKMMSEAGRQWFSVFRRATLEENYEEEGAILLTAGSNVVTVMICELVLVKFASRLSGIIGPDGKSRVVKEGQEVIMECVITSPSTTLRVLPVEEVVNFGIFNH